MNLRIVMTAFGLSALLTSAALAAGSEDQHTPPATAAVDFGVLPTAPLGPPPCFQTGVVGGPTDPCAYMLHHLTPEETTVKAGGEVTFQFHGGGHAFAIYQVDKKTTREGIGKFLCAGPDPSTISDPSQLNCNLSDANANASHVISDAKGRVVIVASPNVTNAFPDNRVWYEPGRFVSAGGQQFMNGGTTPAGPASNGQLLTFRFLNTGRYLVICMNRTHSLNDWMFGFVNVSDDEDGQ